MRKFIILFIFSILLYSHPSFANPGSIPLISEVYFDDNDNWTIELCNKAFPKFTNLDSIRIVTTTDTSTIKFGLEFKNNCILLTNENLDNPIKLMRAGDCIHFEANYSSHIWYSMYANSFMWGVFDKTKLHDFDGLTLNYTKIAPRKGQSLCAILTSQYAWADQFSQKIVLVSSPTLGYDFFNAESKSSISGTIYDKYNKPAENAWVSLGSTENIDFFLPILTDSLGNFHFKNLFANEYTLSVKKINKDQPQKNSEGYYVSITDNFKSVYDQKIFLEPDSNTAINIELKEAISTTDSLKNLYNFSIKQLSDSLMQISFDIPYKNKYDYPAYARVFVADEYGKIIYSDYVFTMFDSTFTTHNIIWNINESETLNFYNDYDNKEMYTNKYRRTTFGESHYYYAVLSIENKHAWFPVTNIKKFKAGK
jgi:hypothetical protein